MCLRRTIVASLMSAGLLLIPVSSLSADVMIITDQGDEHVGEVIAAGVNTLRMKLGGSGYQIIPMKSIAWVKVDIADSAPVEGKLIDWSDGEVVIRVGDRDVGVRDGIITSVVDVGVAAGGPELSTPPQPAADEQLPAAETPSSEPVPANATM